MISVIIPVYKTEPYIRKCLDSVASQTYSELEILLIDDGSPDGCPAICDEYAARDARFRVWHCKNQGVSHARNVGLEHSKGEWVCCVDSDDWLEQDMFETMLEIAERTGAKTICCGAFQGDEDGVTVRNIWRHFEENEHIYEGKAALAGIIDQSATLWNKLLWGERARKLRFDEHIRFAEDTLFLAKYLEEENKAAVTKECLYYYRSEREGNVVTAALNERHIDFLKATGMLYELLEKNGATDVGLERVVDALIRVLALIENRRTSDKYLNATQQLAQLVSVNANKLFDKRKNVKQLAKYMILWLARRKSMLAVEVAKLLKMVK